MGDPIPEPRPEKKKRPRLELLVALGVIASLGLGGFNTLQAIQSYEFAGQHSVAVIATYTFGAAPGQQILSAGTTGDFTLSVYYAGMTPVTLVLTFSATNPASFGARCLPLTNCPSNLVSDLDVFIAGQGPIGPSNAGLPVDYQTSATVTLVNGANDFAGQIAVSPSATVQSFVLSWTGTIQ